MSAGALKQWLNLIKRPWQRLLRLYSVYVTECDFLINLPAADVLASKTRRCLLFGQRKKSLLQQVLR